MMDKAISSQIYNDKLIDTKEADKEIERIGLEEWLKQASERYANEMRKQRKEKEVR